MGMLGRVRRHAVAAAAGVVLLGTGVGFGAAAVSSPGTQETADTAPVTETTAPTTTPEVTSPADTAAPTVADVTSSPSPSTTTVEQPAPVPEAAEAPAEEAPDPSIGTFAPNGDYVPAGPPSRPGQPPMGEVAPEAPVERLPGEVGYVPPGGGEPPVLDIDG